MSFQKKVQPPLGFFVVTEIHEMLRNLKLPSPYFPIFPKTFVNLGGQKTWEVNPWEMTLPETNSHFAPENRKFHLNQPLEFSRALR